MIAVRRRTIGLLASLLLGAAAAQADPPPDTGTLVVRVSTPGAKTDAPPTTVAGATVVVTDARGEHGKATTDAEGIARFAALPEGDYTVRVEAERFAGEEKEVTVEAEKQATVSVSLAAGVPFDGTVLDDATGRPIAGAAFSVEARGAVGGFMSAAFRAPYAKATTDAQGRFHVPGVPEGQVATVEARASGHAVGSFPLRILGGKVTPSPVVVRLPLGGTISGVVRDPDGHPLANATVYVMPAASEDLRRNPRGWRMGASGVREQALTATSGGEGRYRVEALPLGVEYVAVADADGFSRSLEVAGLALGKAALEAKADLALRPLAVLTVRLVDLTGKPVLEAATVSLGESPGSTERKKAPDEANLYRFAGLEPGEWPVKVETPSYRTQWAKAVVEAGKSAEVVVHLDPGLSIAGVTVDEQGKPVVGAQVGVQTVGGEDPSPSGWVEIPIFGRTATSDAQGRFVVRGLPAKEADVDARVLREKGKDPLETEKPVRVKPPATDVRLVLVQRGSAVLRLVTPDGKPYTGPAFIMDGKKRVSSSGGPRTVRDGWVEVTGLEEAVYEVDVRLADYLDVHREFQGHLRTRLDLGTVTLDPGLPLKGRVVDLSGAPVAGARVSGSDGRVATDEHGAFLLAHEPRGKIQVEVGADGYLETKQDVEVVPEGKAVEIRMPRGALVQGVLKDADGNAAPEDVYVWRIGDDGKRLDEEEEIVDWGRDETFSIRLAPGRYRFVARASERGGTPPPLGDFSFAEGEVRSIELKRPR